MILGGIGLKSEAYISAQSYWIPRDPECLRYATVLTPLRFLTYTSVFSLQGYSMSHALRKWAALGYICHYFMFSMLLITQLIKNGTLFDASHWLSIVSQKQPKPNAS